MSCLFDSLSICLQKIQINITSIHLRNQICDYLLQNEKMIDDITSSAITEWESNMSISDYVVKMRNSSTWGGAIEIKAFCDLYNVEVNVYNTNNSIINFISNDIPYITMNLRYNGNHYTPY